MRYTDLIFDLYGTLLDIRREVTDTVWEKTAMLYGFYGAHYTPQQLKQGFETSMALREAEVQQRTGCLPEVPMELAFSQLFRDRGIDKNADALGIQAAQLFRICAIEHLALYPGVVEALSRLRSQGYRLWLLSNAQAVFTRYELSLVVLGDPFDGMYLSSELGCRKPDPRFFRSLLEEQQLNPLRCLMIGNDRLTDIAGAQAVGLDTLFLHTNLTPADQAPADPLLRPDRSPEGHHFEWEGSNWREIAQLLSNL